MGMSFLSRLGMVCACGKGMKRNKGIYREDEMRISVEKGGCGWYALVMRGGEILHRTWVATEFEAVRRADILARFFHA